MQLYEKQNGRHVESDFCHFVRCAAILYVEHMGQVSEHPNRRVNRVYKEIQTDGRPDRRTDGRTDGRTL